MKLAFSIAVALLLSFLLGAPLLAQDMFGRIDEIGHLSAQGTAEGGAGTSRGGSASILRLREEAALGPFTVVHQVDHFSWGDKDSIAFGTPGRVPWTNFQQIEIDGGYMGRVARNLSLFGQVQLISGFEGNSDGSLWWSITPGGIWDVFPDLKVITAVNLTISSLGVWPYPIAMLNWKPSFLPGVETTLGFPNSELAYHPDGMFTFRLAMEWAEGIYRLNDNSSVRPRGYVHNEYSTVGGYVDIEPRKNFILTFGVGGALFRNYEIYDNRRNQVEHFHFKDAPAGTIKLSYKF